MVRARITFLRASAAALAAAALPLRGAAQNAAAPAALRLGATPSDDMTPIVYGTKAGIFSRAGLDLQVTRMSNGPSVMAGVLSGAFDIGKTSIQTVFDAHEKGLPFTIVAIAIVYLSKAPYAAYVVPRDSSIRTGKDFNNQLISTGAIGGIGQTALFAWVDTHGGDSKSVRFVEIPYTAAVAAVESGRVMAAEMSMPAMAVAIDRGMRTIPVFDALGLDYPFVVWVTTKDFSAKRPELVRTFYRAYSESATYTNAHHAETAPLMAEFTGIALGTIQHMTRGEAGTSLNAAQIQPVIDTCVKFGALKRGFPAQELIDVNARA
jgi:NitT/TauT family transport system substrate-binding protein